MLSPAVAAGPTLTADGSVDTLVVAGPGMDGSVNIPVMVGRGMMVGLRSPQTARSASP